ncbi:hypothetical protein P7D22_04615 [Lichenihabitans sp. Uapishka_5]|uniref:hypothetical protein n=1 Tax=Lichenihabitans sp. Uapishka_5 TaxID=3037302 RepID=UPI0029E82055|nr:hypothetical protein [Lichenihabitans sp. Uapishka_5]MDX7950462.1 hypothetical protein [Lichenihabitans sp. Uapishka_5]
MVPRSLSWRSDAVRAVAPHWRLGGRAMAGVALAILAALGIGLRVAAAWGPLGLDEMWSLTLARGLPSIGDAFWGLPHDNNHAFNTAIMVALGPDRPAWVYRVPAIALGVIAMPVLARSLAGAGAAAALTGALLMAVGLPFVDFGSEARGYAGLVLATVIAVDRWRCAMAAPDPTRMPGRWGLAAAAGLGAFSHLTMVMTVAVLGVATLLLVGDRARRFGPVLGVSVRLFAPTALALVPAALALAVAIRRGSGLRIGDIDPFTPAKLFGGLGDMVALTLGLPASPATPLLLVVLLACLAAAARRGLVSSETLALGAASFVALPVALWAAHVPNVGYPRYFAICAVVLVFTLGEVAGRLWRRGDDGRRWMLATVALVATANLLADGQAIRAGRSAGPETLAIMRAEGPVRYATNRRAMATLLLGAASAEPADPASSPCALPSPWYVAVGDLDMRSDGSVTLGAGACASLYRVRKAFASNPMSGTQWTLYRLVSEPSRANTVSPGRGT